MKKKPMQEAYLPKIQEFFLTELLQESYMSNSEIFSMSRSLGYSVEFRSFYCTLLTPINLTQSLAIQDKASRYQLFHSAAQRLGRFCGRQSTHEFQMISAVLGREIAILTSVPFTESKPEIQASSTRLSALLDEFLADCESQFGLKLRATTSTLMPLDAVSRTYDQAKELSGFITMLSLPDRNLFYEDVILNGWEVYDKKHIAETKQWEGAFLNALERSDFHRIQALLHQMAEYEFRQGYITIQASTAVLYTLLNKFRMVLDVMRPLAGSDVLDVFDTAPRILYRKSVAEVMEQIDMIFTCFFNSQESSDSQALPAWVTKMDLFISENFTDPDLNVSTISDHFGLNASYAGRSYKSLLGLSVLDRINRLRIDMAVRLLGGNMLLKDVAVAVGYGNRQRMNRAFQKYVGYTPKEAKEGSIST